MQLYGLEEFIKKRWFFISLNKDELICQLTPHIDKEIAAKIVQYYLEAKSAFLKNDFEKATLKSGKFVEEVIRALEFIVSGKVIDSISVNGMIKSLANLPQTSQKDEIRIIIPRVLQMIYTFRNKRSIAHSSKIDPLLMDAKICISSIDWVLSELLRLFHNYSDEKINEIIQQLVRKRIPYVQNIGGKTITLSEKLAPSDAFLLILNENHPNPVNKTKLYDYFVKYHSGEGDAAKILEDLEQKRLIHCDEARDYRITKIGLEYIENTFI